MFDSSVSRSTEPGGDVERRCLAHLAKCGIPYELLQHEPVLDYATAEVIRTRFALRGVESKSVFLEGHSGRFYMYVTLEGHRVDQKWLKAHFGDRVKVATPTSLEDRTGCVPGCACPLGLPEDIQTVVDPVAFSASAVIFSPGSPTRTIELSQAHWRAAILAVTPSPAVVSPTT